MFSLRRPGQVSLSGLRSRYRVDQIPQAALRIYTSPVTLWALVAFGVVLRLGQYAKNRPLWHDEASLALNIIDRSPAALLEPLSYDQAAPLLFLLLEKLSVEAFGISEQALRLVPLLSGITALVLFRLLVAHVLEPLARPLAVGLFATSSRLVYFSAEVKQYMGDVAAIAAVLLLAAWSRSRSLRGPEWLLLASVGAALPWLSQASVFGLAAAALALVIESARSDRRRLGRLALAFASWGASFVTLYLVSLRASIGNDWLQRYWQPSFAPLPDSMENLGWFARAYTDLFRDVLGVFDAPSLLVLQVLALLGILCAARRDHFRLTLLCGPVLLALAASGLHLYPFKGRLLLFTAPLLCVLAAAGAKLLVDGAQKSSPVLARALLGLGIVGLLIMPLGNGARALASERPIRVHGKEAARALFAAIRDDWRRGDALLFYNEKSRLSRYYLGYFGFEASDEVPRGSFPAYLRQPTPRLWVVLLHVGREPSRREQTFLAALSHRGDALDEVRRQGVSAYLYRMQ